MNRTHRMSIVVFLVAAFAAAPLSLAASQPGWYYESVTGSTDAKGKEVLTRVHASISGPYAVIRFVDAPKKGMFKEGAYLMTRDGSETLYLVDPKEKEYSVIDVGAMLNFATSMLASMEGIVNLNFENIQHEKLLEENGGQRLNRDTVHFRWKSSYTMTAKIIGFKSRNDIELLQDIWFTDAIDDAPGFDIWLSPEMLRTGNDELDEILGNEFAKIDGRFPLMNETVMTTTNKKGKQTITRTWTEVVVMREEPFDISSTDIPDNYELRPMMLPNMEMPPPGAEPSDQADATTDGAAAEDDEALGNIEKAKKKFKGMFKKKKKKKD